MAHEPGMNVTPTWTLAKLALISEDQEEDRAIAMRRSTLSGEFPFSLAQIEGITNAAEPTTTNGVSGEKSANGFDKDRRDSAAGKIASGDTGSDVTLVNEMVESPQPVDETVDGLGRPRNQTVIPIHAYRLLGEPMVKVDGVAPDHPARAPPLPPQQKKPTLPPRNEKPDVKIVDHKEALKKAIEDVAQQQDVFEVISKILYKIMYAIKPDSEDSRGYQNDRIRDLFFGTRVWKFLPKVTDDSEDFWYSLELPLHSAPKDVYELLDSAMDMAEVTFNNKPAPRYSTFTKMPPIMQMCLGRQGFEDGRAYVIKHHVELNEVIYMDRYMSDGAPDILERRQASWALKTRLRSLEATKKALSDPELGLDAGETMEAAYQWIEDIGDDILDQEINTKPQRASKEVKEVLMKGLKARAKEFRERTQILDNEIQETRDKLNGLFTDLTRKPYHLAAVFVHRGQDRAGHYWVYIRDFTANVWRRYEDHRVTEVADTAEIFKKGDPQTEGAPYLVAYVEDAHKEQLIHPLFRAERLEDAEPTSPEDAEMSDAADMNKFQRADTMGSISQTPIMQGYDTAMENVDLEGDQIVLNGVDPNELHRGT